MKRKLVCVVLALIFAFSSTMFIFASSDEHALIIGFHFGDECCLSYEYLSSVDVMTPDGDIITIEELLEKLNAGTIVPSENVTTYTARLVLNDVYDYDSDSADARIPWTECSNVFGHNWGAWSNWVESHRTHSVRLQTGRPCIFAQLGHSTNSLSSCVMYTQRFRVCLRTNCHMVEVHESDWGIACPQF